MTKAEALKRFFSGFNMPAYPSTAVPDVVEFPYITYENKTGYFGDSIPITVNVWFRTTSESKPNKTADDIAKAIGDGGIQLSHNEGIIWVKRGTPWSTALFDGTDSTFKRRMLNVTLDFL